MNRMTRHLSFCSLAALLATQIVSQSPAWSGDFRFPIAAAPDFQDVAALLAPMNLRQLDRLSKPMFDDFFQQKEKLSRQQFKSSSSASGYRRDAKSAVK